MTVEVGDKKYDVYLCDEHGETATIGTVRKKLEDTIHKIKEMVLIAQDLGINVSEFTKPNKSKQPQTGVRSESAEPIMSAPEPTQQPIQEPIQQPSETKTVRKRTSPAKIIDGNNPMPKLDEVNEVMEMQQVSADKGGTIEIPKHEEGGCGVTDISIVKTTDQNLQTRFKRLDNIQDREQNGYSPPCTACQGTGIHPITNEACPKCGGLGMLML